MSAEDNLALGRPSLLPLAGLTPFQHPAETVPKLVAAIRTVEDAERQVTLLGQLVSLLNDEDIEEIRRRPFLWQMYQRAQEEGRAEGERQRARADILDALVARFDPTASEYRKVEQALNGIQDSARLTEILLHGVLRAATFAECAEELFKQSTPT